MISHLGAMLPVACGLALGAQLRGERRVAAAFTGDGATSEGDFHEALNLAAVWKLPVVFVVENNQWGLSTPVHEQYACRHLADRGLGYGMPGLVVDGNDLMAVIRAVRRAAERARRGDGPTLLEFKTYRMRGHEEASGTDYVPKQELDEWAKKDPLRRFEGFLVEQGVASEAELGEVRAAHKQRVDALVDEALQAREPGSGAEAALADVFAPSLLVPKPPPAEAVAAAAEMRYVDAISDALRVAMRRGRARAAAGTGHRRVRRRLQGDRGLRGRVRQGARAQHADHRVGGDRLRARPRARRPRAARRDAVRGLHQLRLQPDRQQRGQDILALGRPRPAGRPRADRRRHRGGAVPLAERRVLVHLRRRAQGGGAFHARGRKGLLIAALEDGNPVLFLEHKLLYRSAKGRVPAGHYTIPIGEARVAREGRDATVVSYGAGVGWALEAAAELARDGRELEVIDLRSLQPWDVERVVSSVKRTGRCLVLHEAPLTGGFGGEVAATIGHEAFEWLDAPVARLGALDTPVPFAKALEAVYSPKDRLLPALRDLLAY